MLLAFEAFWVERNAWTVLPFARLNTSTVGTNRAVSILTGRSTWQSRGPQ
jgi:hypothetical protein